MIETEEEIPIIDYARVLGTSDFKRGYLKCRLVHLLGQSIVTPDVLMVGGLNKSFFSPNFFTANCINFFGGDGSSDHCTFSIDLTREIRIQVVFFKHKLIKKCADHSFIYKCAFMLIKGDSLPAPQGVWRVRGDKFELALYHHTNAEGEKGIRTSKEIWGSAWNIQGTTELKNIAYGYFTSVPRIENPFNLLEIGMSDSIAVSLLPTNAPLSPEFSYPLQVYRQTTADRDRPLQFWVDVEMISPSHLLRHSPDLESVYYEVVLPKVFRVGVNPGQTIPLKGMMLNIKPEARKRFDYIIIGDADTQEGLIAPFTEEETEQLGKIDIIPSRMEIIGRWDEKRNSPLFQNMEVEVAELDKETK